MILLTYDTKDCFDPQSILKQKSKAAMGRSRVLPVASSSVLCVKFFRNRQAELAAASSASYKPLSFCTVQKSYLSVFSDPCKFRLWDKVLLSVS